MIGDGFGFFFFVQRVSTPVGTPHLSMQVKTQPTHLTLGVYFCVYGPFLSHHLPEDGARLPMWWDKNGLAHKNSLSLGCSLECLRTKQRNKY